jgi:hypothetical protein
LALTMTLAIEGEIFSCVNRPVDGELANQIFKYFLLIFISSIVNWTRNKNFDCRVFC